MRVCVCACVRACVRVRALKIVSTDKILRFTYTLIIIINIMVTGGGGGGGLNTFTELLKPCQFG